MRFAVRGVLAHRWFSAAIVATLALGIGLNTMVYTLVNAVLLKPVPVPNGDPIVVLVVALTLAFVGLFACWLPARRATGLDPVKAIRYE